MSVYLDVEVPDEEIVSALVGNPELMVNALRKLAKRKDGMIYRQALDLLAQHEPDDPVMGAEPWAAEFGRMDCIEQDKALHELWRVAPTLSIWKKP